MINEIAEHLSRIVGRVLYNEHSDSVHGPNRSRASETAGLTWALGELSEHFPEEMAAAERIAEAREQQRNRR
ncbi:MAG: hypothetical protein JWP01_3389 [Myxococcales bacterium]|nr:hypothetical protein [Myxococcales bacterium]